MTDRSLRDAGEEHTLTVQPAPLAARPDAQPGDPSGIRADENPATDAEPQAATGGPETPHAQEHETGEAEEHDGVYTLCDLVGPPESSSPEQTEQSSTEQTRSKAPLPEQIASDQGSPDQTLPDPALTEPWPGAAGNPPAPPVPPCAE